MSDRIQGFDGIRALAAITVVLTHLGVYASLVEGGWISSAFAQAINGGAGVQAFFVMSGFLITHLLVGEWERYGRISVFNFFVRRVLRIFPLYFLIVALIVVAHLVGSKVTNWTAVTYAMVYASNFIPKEHYSPILGHTWSLAVEEHFYLLWPFVFYCCAGRRKFLCVLLLLSISMSCFVLYWLMRVTDLEGHYFINRWSFFAGVNIAFGCLASLLISGSQRDKFTSGQRILLLVVSVFAILNNLVLSEINHYSGEYLRGIGFALFVSWIYLNQSGRVVRYLELQPLRYIGTVSYGVYMYQGLFLSTGAYRLPGQTWPPSPALGVVLLIVVVPLSYHFFEAPVLSLKDSLQRSLSGGFSRRLAVAGQSTEKDFVK